MTSHMTSRMTSHMTGHMTSHKVCHATALDYSYLIFSWRQDEVKREPGAINSCWRTRTGYVLPSLLREWEKQFRPYDCYQVSLSHWTYLLNINAHSIFPY